MDYHKTERYSSHTNPNPRSDKLNTERGVGRIPRGIGIGIETEVEMEVEERNLMSVLQKASDF